MLNANELKTESSLVELALLAHTPSKFIIIVREKLKIEMMLIKTFSKAMLIKSHNLSMSIISKIISHSNTTEIINISKIIN